MRNDNAALLRRFFLLPLTVGQQEGEAWNCLFTQNQVVEVVGQATRLYPVPFSPPYLLGCILRHDTLIPVVDVDLLCSGGAERKKNASIRQILVIRTGQIDAASGEFLRLAMACSGNVLTFKLTDRDVAGPFAPLQAPPSFDGQGLDLGFFQVREHRAVLMDFDAIVLGTFRFQAQDATQEKKA